MPGDNKRNVTAVSYAESVPSDEESGEDYQGEDASTTQQPSDSDFQLDDVAESGDEGSAKNNKAHKQRLKSKANPSPAKKKGARSTQRETPSLAAWGPEQTAIMINKMASIIMEHRKEIYTAEGLEQWRGNGGSAINQRIKQTLMKTWSPLGLSKLDAGAQQSPRKKTKVKEDSGEKDDKGVVGGGA